MAVPLDFCGFDLLEVGSKPAPLKSARVRHPAQHVLPLVGVDWCCSAHLRSPYCSNDVVQKVLLAEDLAGGADGRLVRKLRLSKLGGHRGKVRAFQVVLLLCHV
jgi:hypothetical protein